MDQRRLILVLVFLLSTVMLWNAWLQHNQPTPTAPAPAATGVEGASVPTPTPSAPAVTGTTIPGAATAVAPVSAAPRVTVRTDLMVAEVSAQGGDIVRLELAEHKASADETKNFVLFDDGAKHVYAAQTGLIGEGLPTHKTIFELPAGEQVLKDGEDSLTLRLEAPEQNGVKVAKLMTFHRGNYTVDVKYEISNAGASPISPHA